MCCPLDGRCLLELPSGNYDISEYQITRFDDLGRELRRLEIQYKKAADKPQPSIEELRQLEADHRWTKRERQRMVSWAEGRKRAAAAAAAAAKAAEAAETAQRRAAKAAETAAAAEAAQRRAAATLAAGEAASEREHPWSEQACRYSAPVITCSLLHAACPCTVYICTLE